MRWKALIICLLLIASVPVARASEPITYKEIAMLLRNGEDQQFIISDTTQRKLIQPLTKDEADDLVSLGATPALMNLLRSPTIIAQGQDVAAYDADLQRQKALLTQQQREDAQQARQEAAEDARIRQPNAQPAAANPNEFAGKPINLHFVASDGTLVDLSTMRGKVVLVDFWATWCGPCMAEVPNVVAAYQKYHDKGLEVVGISLDKDKDAMLQTIQDKGMMWPQYFDGKAWQNDISTSFHIQEIPTMWLINKQGILEIPNPRADLEGSIQKLLAE